MKQDKQKIDWDNLGFNPLPTRSMWKGECVSGDDWINGKLIPYGEISLSPAACVLNYGQGIFEGMKAYKDDEDKVWLFRPDQNFKRINRSSERLQIPVFPENYFFEGLKTLLNLKKNGANFFRGESNNVLSRFKKISSNML